MLIIVGLVAACSDSSDDGESGSGNSVTSITLSTTNATTILAGESISFSAIDNLNNDVTTGISLSINGTTISNPHTFDNDGVYDVVASYNSITSNSISISVVAPATSIAVTSDKSSAILEIQESFNFTVTGDNNLDYSDSSTIYVDGVAIAGHVFTPTEFGTQEIYATNDNLTSNTLTLDVVSGVNSISVNLSESSVKIQEEIEFSAVNNYNNDVTAEATFYVDGVAISGTIFSAATSGAHQVYAVYTSYNGDLTSTAIDFEVYKYTQKVLVEDYTGTWCGYCPRLAYNLEQAEQQNSSVIGVAIHDDDDMLYEYAVQMESQYGITGFPSGRINRTITWNESLNQIFSFTETNQGLGLAINSTLSGNSVSADIKVGYDTATSGNKIVVYLMEDGLIYPQVNYYNSDSSSPWYQTGDPIQDFEHNNVLRKAFTNIFGDEIPDGSVGGEYSNTYTLSIPSDVQNNSKLEIVAFVLDGSGTVLNVQHSAIGVNQDYD